jgi:DNA-binding transcriptional LysR family regulator
MELRHLRYFVAVAEELSFTRAADRLYVVQPTLSGQIKQLEQELGVELFDRSRRAVQLTPAGSMLLIDAVRLLDDADGIVQRMRSVRGATESLSVGFTAATAVGPVVTAISEFQVRHPEVGLSMRSTYPAELMRDLEARRADIVITHIADESPPFQHLLLAVERVAVALPPDHRLAGEDVINLGDLAEDDFLLPPRWRSPDIHGFVMGLCRQAGFEPKVSAVDLPLASRVALVAHGAGVAMVGTREEYLAGTGAVIRPIRDDPRLYLDAVWRDEAPSPARTAFLDTLREVFAEPAPSG